MFRIGKKRNQGTACSITVPEDPLQEGSPLSRTSGWIVGDKVVYAVTAGLLKGFDCWVPLCECTRVCADESGAGTAAAGQAFVCRQWLAVSG